MATDNTFGVDWSKVIYGQNAIHVPGRFVLQNMGNAPDGKQIALIIGYVVGDVFSDVAKAGGHQHELIVGDIVIRPHQKATGDLCLGMGAEAIVTSGAFDPKEWEKRSL